MYSHPFVFENLDYRTQRLIYEGLLALVQSNSGEGFHNSDQGHPAYRLGRENKYDYDQWGDAPEHNLLYKMMHELSVSLNEQEEGSTITEFVFSWQDFCILATDAYDRLKRAQG